MLYRIKTVDGAKTKVPLAGSTPAGLPGTQSHDVFIQGEFKDDQLQDHIHGMSQAFRSSGEGGTGQVDTLPNQSPINLYTKLVVQNAGARTGTTTHGKQKGV